MAKASVRGVQVDRCFSCNGTWLDAGELEKLGVGQKEGSVLASILRVFGGAKK